MMNLLYYEYWTDKQKYLYVYCVNPLCSCSLEVESVFHFFLRCHSFTDIRKTLFHELQLVDENILNQSDNETAELLLYGSGKFKLEQNCSILRSAIKFIIKSERFSGKFSGKDSLYSKMYRTPLILFVLSVSNMHINHYTTF